MMDMLRSLFNYMGRPGEIKVSRAVNTFIGRRRFLDVDVQGIDGTWHRRRIYIRAQPSREIFRCDIPFKEKRNSRALASPGHFNKRVRGRAARRPLLIAPLFSFSVRPFIIERGYEAWRCRVVWKPRLRTQGNRTKCEISLEWLKVYRDLARIVRWFLRAVAARVMRARWGPPKPRIEKGPLIDLAAFMRPDPWPPPRR